MISYTGMLNMPGPQAMIDAAEGSFAWGSARSLLWSPSVIIDSGATDPGNSADATTRLRAGLILGQVTSSQKLKQWDPTATDGTQRVYGILPMSVPLVNPLTQATQDAMLSVVIGGPVKAGSLYSSIAAISYAINHIARAQMRGRFVFDDDVIADLQAWPWSAEWAFTADTAIVVATHGNNALITNAGATGSVAATLPAIVPGLSYDFQVVANQTFTITSPEGTNIVTDGNAGATSLAFSTSSHKIGGRVRLHTNMAGTKWYTEVLCTNTITVS